MSVETIWEEDGVYQRYTESITPEDCARGKTSVMGSENLDQIQYWLVDASQSTEYLLGRVQAVEAAGHDYGAKVINDNVLKAFVTTSPAHRKNIEIYMETLKLGESPWKVAIFDTVAEARAWINENRVEKRKRSRKVS